MDRRPVGFASGGQGRVDALAAVTSVLETAVGPMRLRDIHRAVEDRAGEPVAYSRHLGRRVGDRDQIQV